MRPGPMNTNFCIEERKIGRESTNRPNFGRLGPLKAKGYQIESAIFCNEANKVISTVSMTADVTSTSPVGKVRRLKPPVTLHGKNVPTFDA